MTNENSNFNLKILKCNETLIKTVYRMNVFSSAKHDISMFKCVVSKIYY